MLYFPLERAEHRIVRPYLSFPALLSIAALLSACSSSEETSNLTPDQKLIATVKETSSFSLAGLQDAPATPSAGSDLLPSRTSPLPAGSDTGTPFVPGSSVADTPRATTTPFPSGVPAQSTPRVRGTDASIVDGPVESPVPSRGAGQGATNSSGSGFYPPMMPPMYPGGGMGSGGVRPGEAEFAGGPVRRVTGPATWLAGLRPQLRGRTGEPEEEPDPPEPPPGDVLDEELWQVPRER